MILLPRKNLFAIVAVVDIALHARPSAVTARALAARHGLAPRQLETVLQALVRSGILTSARGPRGGYELARERRRITLGEIVRAAGLEAPGDADPTGDGREARHLMSEVVIPAVAAAGAGYLRELERISVEDLCRQADAETAGANAESRHPIDFTI